MTVFSHFFWNWYPFRGRLWVWKFAWGGVIPDLPYCVFLGYYSVRWGVNGLLDLAAWDLAWRHPLIVSLHSFVPCLTASAVLAMASRPLWRRWRALWAGWLSHVIIDMFTHRSDGYPIFYPLSAYRFPTPISYWEPAFHGREFMLVNDSLMIGLLLRYVWLRRRARRLALASTQPLR